MLCEVTPPCPLPHMPFMVSISHSGLDQAMILNGNPFHAFSETFFLLMHHHVDITIYCLVSI